MSESHLREVTAAATDALGKGDLDAAESAAKALIEMSPASSMPYHVLSHVAIRRGQLVVAHEMLFKAVQLSPASVTLQHELGMVYQRLGKISEASECYRRCSELEPKNGYYRELHTQSLLEQMVFAMEGRKIGREASKSYAAKIYSGFFKKYLSGANVLDIGFRGGFGEAEPIVRQATGIDLGFPGYDGIHLPFASNSQDAIYTSHCLEHMNALPEVIAEWFRVLKVGGYAVVVVPHQYLYERKSALPSVHPDHKHMFTPASLLATFESALRPNTYRVRHLMDNDLFYDYAMAPDTHPVGCYEIELVLEKIAAPVWELV